MIAGWIKLNREIVEHWLWQDEPFTRGQAWLDLLLHANHKPTRLFIRNRVVYLNRGEQARSEVTLSATWKWSRNKVRRFLKLLKAEQMIEQRTIQATSIITICNYSKYQARDTSSDTGNGTANDTAGDTGAEQVAEQESIQGRNSTRHTEEECKECKECKELKTLCPIHQNAGAISEPIEPPTIPGQKPSKKKTNNYKFETADHEIAVRISNPVKTRFPTQEIDLDQWADTVRKLVQIDGRSRADIMRLWLWITRHQNGRFSWADQIRSPMKLRAKDNQGLVYFERLWGEMIRDQSPPPQKQNTVVAGKFSRVSDQNISAAKAWLDQEEP